jgi:hypothetical protein
MGVPGGVMMAAGTDPLGREIDQSLVAITADEFAQCFGFQTGGIVVEDS